MEQIVIKKEPEELVNDYDKPSNQEMPSTSGVAVKQEIKEEFNYSDNFRVHIELGVKEELDEEDNFDGGKLKFEAKDEVLFDKGRYIITLPQRYLNLPAHNFGLKVKDSDQESNNSDHGDKSEDLPCNIKEEERDSDFSQEDDKHFLNNEEKDEDEAMFETKMEVEYHGVKYDESGTDREVANKEEKEIGKKDPRCVYECKQCSVIFLKKELLESHRVKCLTPEVGVDKEKMFKCYICQKKFQTKKGLLNHKKFIHNKEKQEKFKCGKCEYQSLREGNLKVHLKIHDRSRYLKCKFCPYLTAALKTLNAHILSKHKLENKGENEIKITSKIHQCAKCSYSTVRKNDYDNHVKVCLKLKNINWFKCHMCPYKTIQKGNLNFHIKSHNQNKELKCMFCPYESNKKQDLDNHILSKHSGMLNESNQNIITSKIHHCQQCNYKTTHSVNLKIHLIHNH